MTDLKQYVDINRHFMTTAEMAEMAEEAGVAKGKIGNILCENGWRAISHAERVREYIQANRDAILEDVAEKYGRTIAQVKTACKELGITLRARKDVKPKLSFTFFLFASWDEYSRYKDY